MSVAIAGCGQGSGSTTSAPPVVPTTSAPPPVGPTTAAATKNAPTGGDFLGCHQFCEQAGAFGGGSLIPSSDDNLSIATNDVSIADGLIPVTITCKRADVCQGAIVVNALYAGSALELGRSDLTVAGHTTRVIGIMVSADGLTALTSSGKLAASIAVNYGQPTCSDSDGCGLSANITVSAAAS
jgi:hypothetical protein